jgi:dihydromonapterin reductase / dihydrofolate reductase
MAGKSKGTILITGVGKRIGLFLARALLEEGFGVIGSYRTHYPALDELRSLGASLYRCDLTCEAELEAMIADIQENHSRLRAIIHNASDWLPDDNPLGAQEIMTRMMAIHVSAPYRINLALAPLLGGDDPDAIACGDIIHITDYVADKGSTKHIAYAASKAALHNLTLSFAAKLAPGVKVNSIAPALILFNEWDDEAYKAKTLAKALMPREAGEQEILDAVTYLLGSSYVTGRSLQVDGGRHLK